MKKFMLVVRFDERSECLTYKSEHDVSTPGNLLDVLNRCRKAFGTTEGCDLIEIKPLKLARYINL